MGATNNVVFRILLFYLGALLIIMSLLPWDQLDPNESPFLTLFTRMGVPGAASFINVSVITAAASSCNGGIFSAARMLYTLSLKGHSPSALGRLSKHRVPIIGVNASVIVMLVGVVLNYFVPKEAFAWVTSIALVGTLWTWIIILVSHAKYRAAVEEGRARSVSYKMPGAPVTNWVVVAFLLSVATMLGVNSGTRVALYVAPLWFGLLSIAYYARVFRKTISFRRAMDVAP